LKQFPRKTEPHSKQDEMERNTFSDEFYGKNFPVNPKKTKKKLEKKL
jgi:hypothetical protein